MYYFVHLEMLNYNGTKVYGNYDLQVAAVSIFFIAAFVVVVLIVIQCVDSIRNRYLIHKMNQRGYLSHEIEMASSVDPI